MTFILQVKQLKNLLILLLIYDNTIKLTMFNILNIDYVILMISEFYIILLLLMFIM